MNTRTPIDPKNKYAVQRLSRETGRSLKDANTAYVSCQRLFDPAKVLLLKGKPVVVVPAPVVEPETKPEKPAPQPPKKPPVAVPAGLDTFLVRMPDGGTLRVMRLSEDYIERSRREWEQRREEEETDELLAIGNTITRALDLPNRIARIDAKSLAGNSAIGVE